MRSADRLQHIEEYYFSRKLKEVRALQAEGKPIINMGIGSPDLEPPKTVVRALQNSVLDASAHKYQSYQGLPELRAAISGFYQTYFDVGLDAEEEILPLMGSKEGILHISLAFLNRGDKVLIPNPGYPTYAAVSHLVGAEPIYYNLKEEHCWLPDFSELAAQDLSGVKLMWISYPHMPTGARATDILFQELIAFAHKHEILLVNDNPYSFILNDAPRSILANRGAMEVALELNSLSKSFNMAGWRVGMLLGSKRYLDAVMKVKTQQDSGMFYAVQKGAIEALKVQKSWFENLNKVYRSRRKLIWNIADALHCSYDEKAVGMFVWAKLPKGVTSDEMIDRLLYEKDIFVAPGHIFGSQGEGYIRFSLCVDELKIKEALNRL